VTGGASTRLSAAIRIAIGLFVCLGAAGLIPRSAFAAVPSTYGWWAQTSVGLGPLGPMAPPDVPPNGLYVQNSASGPIAISALQFLLPAGTEPSALTLHITGRPVITIPPIICPATSSFGSVEDGAWSLHPSYDCSHPVTGRLDASRSAVQFDVAQLVRDSALTVVVLAGGTADRIPFSQPGTDALGLVNLTPTIPSGRHNSVVQALPAPSHVLSRPNVETPSAAIPSEIGHVERNGLRVASPVLAPPAAAGQPPTALSNTRPSSGPRKPDSRLRDTATTVGVMLLILSILYWADGFGAVPVRSILVRRERSIIPRGGPR
jgi:hypothetical protein